MTEPGRIPTCSFFIALPVYAFGQQWLKMGIVVFLLGGMLFPLNMAAHGPIHEKIKDVTRRIEETPDLAELYLKRSQYHRIDKNFPLAEQDLDTYRKMAPNDPMLMYHQAALFAAFDSNEAGIDCINQFLSASPDHVGGLILRAGLYKKMGNESSAAADFSHAIEYMKTPTPSNYIDIAEAILGADSTQFDEARKYLKMGEERLGFNIVLASYHVDILIKENKYQQAISQIDEIIGHLPRSEKWTAKKGEVYLLAGDKQKALASYQQAKQQLETLPPRRRSVRIFMELEAEIDMKLIELKGNN